jgi:hypothetical protein
MWWVEYEKNLQLVLRFLSDERDELLELRARVRASENTIRNKRKPMKRPVFAEAAPISP